MLEENKIKELFSESSLQNEDWLQPSDAVLEGINEELFDGKKKRPLWIFLLPLIILLALLTILITGFINKPEEIKPTNDSSQKISYLVDPALSAVESNISLSDGKFKLVTDENLEGNTLILDSNKSNKSTLEKTPASKKIEFSLNQNKQEKNLEPIQLDQTQKHQTNDIQSLQNLDVMNLEKLQTVRSIDSAVKKGSRLIEITTPVVANPIELIQPKSWIVSGSIAYSTWVFALNDNYQSALSPADFWHENGQGVSLNLSIENSITQKTSFGLNIGIDRIRFTSGHNSSIIYDITQEQGTSNELDVNMATPLGFINSAVIIERTLIDPSNDAYALTVDLSNEHELSNLDLGLFMRHQLVNSKHVDVSFSPSFGLSYLSSINNTLEKVNVLHDGFESPSNTINSNQENINRLRPYLGLGLNISKSICKNTELSLGYEIRRELSIIHRIDDLSTTLTRQYLSAGIQKNF